MSFQQGLSGLNAAAKQLDTIGNNVANASTVGFKQSQAQFADTFAASLTGGGSVQIGTGTKVAAVSQQFTQGNVTNTSNTMDTAISGQGFFRMIDQSGAILYTRNGQFQIDKDGYIVNNQGHQLSGYLPDANGVIVPVQPAPLQISSADLVPKQTSNLAAGGVPVGVGVNLDSRATFPTGFSQGNVAGNALAGLTIVSAAGETPGSVTTGAAVTNFDYSTNSISFDVDATTVTLNADYTNAAGVAAAIGVQLGAPYSVTENAGVITIATTATGVPAPVVSAYDGDVDGIPTLVPDVISGGPSTETAGSVDTGAAVTVFDYSTDSISFTVDGNPVLLNANYLSAAGVAAEIGLQLGATYGVTESAGVITIATTATGTAAPVIAAYNGDVDGNVTSVPDVITGGPGTETAGSVDTAAAVTAFDYSTNAISFDVDATTITLNADYTNAAGVAAEIGSQLGATYTVTESAGVITIATTATGTPAPVISAYNGDVDGIPTLVANVIGGGTSVNGVAENDTFTVTVDGVTSGTVTIPPATYSNASALASAIQAAINSDIALIAASKSVTVSASNVGVLTITSNSAGPASTVAVSDVALGSVSNLLGGAPVSSAGAGVFDPTDPSTYNNSTSLTVYDSLGTNHIASLYFQKSDFNNWNVYLTIDGAILPAAGTPLTTLNFNTLGQLIAPAGPPLGEATSSIFTPPGAAAQTLTFDFSPASQYGGNFGVNSLTQDGYTSGRLNGFSTSSDGTILGRYSNGQSRAMGQMLLANFTNPQGLQPVGNNEWVETFSSGSSLLGVPGSASLGVVQSSAVEDSNVDLTAELVNMITAQRVYQANAQTIKTQDQVLQTLVNLR